MTQVEADLVEPSPFLHFSIRLPVQRILRDYLHPLFRTFLTPVSSEQPTKRTILRGPPSHQHMAPYVDGLGSPRKIVLLVGCSLKTRVKNNECKYFLKTLETVNLTEKCKRTGMVL